ncbi:MAG TPA: hypothetical protein VF997_23440, partial [Polyangia bacterium]
MRTFVLMMVVLAPLSARADASVEDDGARRIERCILAVRRALAVDYPRDDDGDDEHYCQRRSAELSCRGVCDDRSCHNDACESWLTSIDVALAPATGATTAWSRRPDVVSGWIYRRRVGGV